MLPGIATRRTASKFLRDSSSFHVVLPGDSGCKRRGVPLEWQAMHRAWPARLARKMGSTLALKKSKLSGAAGAACWPNNPAKANAKDTMAICTTDLLFSLQLDVDLVDPLVSPELQAVNESGRNAISCS